jgi:uncharacterized GH25 family protein
MLKNVFLIVLFLFSSWLGEAHEFWLQPEKFRYKPGDVASLSFRVGENFIGEPWNVKKQRIQKFRAFHLADERNLASQIVEGEKDNVKIPLTEEGTHLVVMESDAAFLASGAAEFNKYLGEDGLEETYEYRKANGLLADSATEFYSRHAKLILQAGSKIDDTYKKTAGLILEIVPLQNPYSLKIGDRIHFKILYGGKPLFGAMAKIYNRYNNRTTVQNIYTQQDGVIETTVSTPGSWMVSIVKMVPSKDKGAQWRSYWSSLVFGI